MPSGSSLRRTVVPRTTGTGAVVAPRAMDAKDTVNFLAAVLVGSLVIIVVGLVGILLS